ncbi:PTS transporter subunit EIIC [Enterobacteriaceae bacterium H20N1]|uniref:PTS system lactose-specific EIICB component n=1 Tax=Dryocola boscaweniae TaxID=2925397 RepID=A0A9X2W9R4_9ENTR|nr:PTS transporter subunit EIIC [Dryocola boscaweniae]MCT4703485.1 PTS transporter subunit EIIC [Dryocola boscaweniae]MCT4720653.1 PTS transporter subunit EIIC [Dryocola boscaweniae]
MALSLDSIASFSQKLAGQIHLRSLRDSFIVAIPFLVLAGLFIMINYVFLDPAGFMKNVISADTMMHYRGIGERVLNGTMNILSVMLAVLIAWSLACKRKFESPIIAAMVSLACFYVLMPTSVSVALPEGGANVMVGGMVPYALTNAGGVFLAIICAFLSTGIFLNISASPKLQISLGEEVPPMVQQSFNALFAIMITVALFAGGTFLITSLFDTEIFALIQTLVQKPLVHLTTSLPGFITLTTLTNLLFALGIHPSGIINPILEPPLLVAMQENMAAFAAGQIPPHIIVLPFRDIYGHMGGTGSTLALLLAIILRSRMSSHKKFAKTVIAPGVFNINEPVIFGLPVILNPLLMIPFIVFPQISFIIAWFATSWGWVSHIVAYVPWSVPPLLSGWLGSGGDLRNVVLQVILIAIGVAVYMPFLIAYERSIMNKKTQTIVDDIQQIPPQNAAVNHDETQAAAGEDDAHHVLNGKKIVLMCNEGMSTSMVARKMKQYAQSIGCTANISATNIGSLEDIYPPTDLIILSPQLAYMESKVRETVKNQCRVTLVNPQHFSHMDGKSIIEHAITLFK